MMRAQGAVVGNTVFLPVAEAQAVYAFDVSTPAKPCVKWAYHAPGASPLRTSAGYGVIAAPGYKTGRKVVVVAGLDSTVHLLDARTGKPLWTKNVASYSFSMTTATPRILKDRIIVPVSQYEIMQAADNKVDCCTNHGFVLSLDPLTGAQQWRYDTMEDAKPLRDRGDGKMLKGPSGAPIWNSPVVDEGRGLIYFGTGEVEFAAGPPQHRRADRHPPGRSRQGGVEHAGHLARYLQRRLRAEPEAQPAQLRHRHRLPRRGLGASLILGKLKDWARAAVRGPEVGHALGRGASPPAQVVWGRDIGTGAANGGIHWGIAFHDDKSSCRSPWWATTSPARRRRSRPEARHEAVNASDGPSSGNFATASGLRQWPRQALAALRPVLRPIGRAHRHRRDGDRRQPRRLAPGLRREDRRRALEV